jgi:hypothetical protein
MDGTYVTALVAGRLTPKYVKDLANLLDSYGMAGDLKDPKYQDPAVIAANISHIIDDSSPTSLPACRQRRFTTLPRNAASPGERYVPRRGSPFWRKVV